MIIALPSLHSFHPSTPANPPPGSPFLVKMDGGVMSEELTRQKGVANQVDVGSHCEISLTIPGSQRVVFLVLVVVLFVLFVLFIVFFVVVFCCCFCFCCFNQIDYEFQLRCVFQWSFDSSTNHHNGYPHNNHNHTTTTTPPQPQQPHHHSHNNHTTTATTTTPQQPQPQQPHHHSHQAAGPGVLSDKSLRQSGEVCRGVGGQGSVQHRLCAQGGGRAHRECQAPEHPHPRCLRAT